MEHKLGETFTWNGHTLEVAEVDNIECLCVGCFFFEAGSCCYYGGLEPCTKEYREDYTNVIFKEQLNTEKL